MRTKHLLLASLGLMLGVPRAHARFLGNEIFSMDHWFRRDIDVGGGAVQTSFRAAGLDSYRVYAVFDSPAVTLGALGETAQPMYVNNLDDGTFFNYTEVSGGGDTVYFDNQQTAGFDVNPAKAYDTFATVGGVTTGTDPTQFSPPGSGADNGGVGNHFQNNWSSAEGTGGSYAWFVTSPVQATQNPVGLFSAHSPYTQDGRYYILLMQLTVAQGAKIEGSITVASDAGGPIPPGSTYFSTNDIPAPAAPVLLGLGGLLGRRCRK